MDSRVFSKVIYASRGDLINEIVESHYNSAALLTRARGAINLADNWCCAACIQRARADL